MLYEVITNICLITKLIFGHLFIWFVSQNLSNPYFGLIFVINIDYFLRIPLQTKHNKSSQTELFIKHQRTIEEVCMSPTRKPVVAVTLGDPAGIGPEICVATMQSEEIYKECNPFLIGSVPIIERAMSYNFV